MKAVVLAALAVLAGLASPVASQQPVTWKHLSSATGDLPVPFSRAAAGSLNKDSPRPQVVFVVGDGDGPLNLYEWVQGTRVSHRIADIHPGHSLGSLDSYAGEQQRDGDGRRISPPGPCNYGSPRAGIFMNQGSGKS